MGAVQSQRIDIQKDILADMKFKTRIFKSEIRPEGRFGPRFADSEAIQSHMEQICLAWAKYLQSYVERTAEMFKQPELPWLNTERAVVSTLAASITRAFPGSIVMEESRVTKPGRQLRSLATKSKDWGRCDLWTSIKNKNAGDFNFYLEAKISPHICDTGNLQEQLVGWYGISRMFRDYMKSHREKLTQRTPYRTGRKHPHYIIGMLLTRLEANENNVDEIEEILRETFSKPRVLEMGRETAETSAPTKQRRMARYPTVAMTVVDPAGKNKGFVVSFTVLGASRGLTTQTALVKLRRPIKASSVITRKKT